MRSPRPRGARARPVRAATVLAAALLLPSAAAHAQAVRCTGFLHLPDGSWRGFETGTVIGSRGPVRVEAGERLRASDKGDKGDIARILDHLCAP